MGTCAPSESPTCPTRRARDPCAPEARVDEVDGACAALRFAMDPLEAAVVESRSPGTRRCTVTLPGGSRISGQVRLVLRRGTPGYLDSYGAQREAQRLDGLARLRTRSGRLQFEVWRSARAAPPCSSRPTPTPTRRSFVAAPLAVVRARDSGQPVRDKEPL